MLKSRNMAPQQLLICILYQYLGTALNMNIVCSLSPPHVSEKAVRNQPRFLSLSETIRNHLHASESLASSHLTDIRGGWPGSWKFKCKTKKPRWEAGSWTGWSGISGHHWQLVANDNDGELESLSAEYYSYSNTSLISHQTNLNGQINTIVIWELDMMRNWSFMIFSKWMLKGRPMISMTLHKIFWWTS